MNKILQAIISTVKKLYGSLPEQNSPETPAAKPTTQQNTTSQPIVTATAKEEPKVNESIKVNQSIVEPVPEPVTIEEVTVEASVIEVSKITTDNFPQDSIQRRHALFRLRTIVETLKGPRPSDSIQSRHYDALINNLVTQALTDKIVLENLHNSYENLPKTLVQADIKPTANIQESIIKVQVEETPVTTQIAQSEINTDSFIPVPPTDSILRRHYDTLINNEINRLLEEC